MRDFDWVPIMVIGGILVIGSFAIAAVIVDGRRHEREASRYASACASRAGVVLEGKCYAADGLRLVPVR